MTDSPDRVLSVVAGADLREGVVRSIPPDLRRVPAAVEDVLDRASTTHAEKLASLMTLNFVSVIRTPS